MLAPLLLRSLDPVALLLGFLLQQTYLRLRLLLRPLRLDYLLSLLRLKFVLSRSQLLEVFPECFCIAPDTA